MPRLVVEKGRQKGHYTVIDRTSAVVIGRGSTADMQIEDPMVSRRHFSVEFKQGGFHIVDLDSANGTFVNGEQVTDHVLEIGDKIECGEVLLSFLADESTIKHDTVTGQKIAGYLIEERVGRGAMGTVYKAVQLSLDRTVALKILARELLKDKNFIDMFVREAQNAGQLNHANIVQVYDVGNASDIYFISMEFMAGGSVYELLNREGAQPFEKAIQIARDSARGLLYAERKQIVHRDIKPDNLMLMLDGTTKIGDLGIARRLQHGSTVREEGIFGSPHYMAPEQAQGLPIDCRTDIYSLGATMYHIMTGKTPFMGKSPQDIILKQINEEPFRLLEVNPMAHEGLARVVEKCMSKDPGERYQSSGELCEVLDDLEKEEKKARSTHSFSDRLKTFKKRHLFPVIIILAAVVAAAAGFLIYRGYQHSAYTRKVEHERALEALSDIKRLFDEKKYEKVIAALAQLERNYSGFPDIIEEAGKIEEDVQEEKKNHARQKRLAEAQAAFGDVEKFIRENPGKLREAVDRYKKVADDFDDTEIAGKAMEQARRLQVLIEETGKLEHAARIQADAIIARARNFRERQRYGRAFEELGSFSAEFGATEAAKDIEKEKEELRILANRSFKLAVEEAEKLIRRKEYLDARAVMLKIINTYEVEEFTAQARESINRIEELIEKQRKQEELVRLQEDKAAFEASRSRARKLIKEHRFDSAVAEYRALQLHLSTDRYKNLAQLKVGEIDLIQVAKETLINQINQNKLARKIKIHRNNLDQVAVRADSDKIEFKFESGVGRADHPWYKFTEEEMVSFLGACSLDAGGNLAAGVYAKELNQPSAATGFFERAIMLDQSLKGEVEKYSGKMK